MSISAGRTFIAAVKSTRATFEKDTNAFYFKFVRDGHKPTAADVKKLEDIVKAMQEVATFYHLDVDRAMQGFGGPSDTVLYNAETLLDTVRKKAK